MRNLEDADISNYLRHNAEGNEMGTVENWLSVVIFAGLARFIPAAIDG
jgi:hypothetical protein